MTLITLKDIGVTLGSNLFSGLNFTLNKATASVLSLAMVAENQPFFDASQGLLKQQAATSRARAGYVSGL
jgi:hypothetical protein